MPFGKSDFEDPDIFERLRALTMVRNGYRLQTKFGQLSVRQRRDANEWLNMYIYKNLNCENWFDILLNDFNEMCNEKIFNPDLNEKKDYSNIFIRQSNLEPVLIDKETDIRDTEYK